MDCLFHAQAPLRETIPVVKRVRASIPAALEIWELSVDGSRFPDWERELAAFERTHEKASMETVATLPVPGERKIDPRIKRGELVLKPLEPYVPPETELPSSI